MLKPVVQDVDGAAEATLGGCAGLVPIVRYEDRGICERPRKHERLVARTPGGGQYCVAVTDDNDAA
jgi:hypothetical protein